MASKGWNWGSYTIGETEMEFHVDDKKCFGIPYAEIALSNANSANEVAFEFAGDAE